MTDEDKTAAKLKGYSCIVKFRDGEELLLKVDEIDKGGATSVDWFMEAERFINRRDDSTVEFFPTADIALANNSVKYIIKL
jgi:hypothetical protein